jgi:hypothetical protein
MSRTAASAAGFLGVIGIGALLLSGDGAKPWRDVAAPTAAFAEPPSAPGEPMADVKADEKGPGDHFNIPIPSSEPLRKKLRAVTESANGEGTPTLLLTVSGVRLPAEPDIEARVFVNKRDADDKTSTEDAHFAGFFSLGAAEQANRPQNYVFNLSPVVRKLAEQQQLKLDEPLVITVVVVGRNAKATLDGVSLRSKK